MPFSDTPIAERPEPALVRDPDDRRRVESFLVAKLAVARRQRQTAAGPFTVARTSARMDAILEVYATLLIGRHPQPADAESTGGETARADDGELEP